MGYTIEATREAAVDPAAIFALYMDPATWSVWGHNVRWARADGRLVEGGTVHVRPKYPVTYHCRILRLVPNSLLRIEVKPVGLRIVNVYEIVPIDGGGRDPPLRRAGRDEVGSTRLASRVVSRSTRDRSGRDPEHPSPAGQTLHLVRPGTLQGYP